MPLRGSENRSAGKLLKVYTQRDLGPGGVDGERIKPPQPENFSSPKIISASGGTETTYTHTHPTFGSCTYKSHTFTSSGSFTITSAPGNPNYDIDYIVIAGGGGTAQTSQGSNREAGSGGGGGLLGQGLTVTSPITYPVTIGGGGPDSGSNGSNSKFAFPVNQVAVGGGKGGQSDPAPTALGTPGGNGGGAWYVFGSVEGGEGTQTGDPTTNPYLNAPVLAYGNDGSPGFAGPEYGGGGGGCGGVGQRGNDNATSPNGLANTYRYGPTNSQMYGAGGVSSDFPSTPRRGEGAVNSGNGSSAKGHGGSGIVVVRYVIAQL